VSTQDTQSLTEDISGASNTASPGKRGKPSLWNKSWPYLAAVGSLLVIWEIGALIENKPFILPDVIQTVPRFIHSFSDAEFMNGVWRSMYRLAVGYPIACLLGALLGLMAGVSRTFAVYLRSLISILQSIPPITWVPFLLLLLGFGDTVIIAVITIASFFPMALSVMNGTEGVNKTHLELARVFGANRMQLLTKVFGPESLPSFITGAQVSFGNAWRSLIASEMVGGASIGLGKYLSYHGEIADMKGVMISIIVIGGIAALLDHVVLERIKRKLLHYRYVSGSGGKE
jgi:NitT/TauT family transport system permease protein